MGPPRPHSSALLCPARSSRAGRGGREVWEERLKLQHMERALVCSGC